MKGSSSHQRLSILFVVLGLLYLSIFDNIVVAVDSSMAPCNGSIAECYEEEEMLMESEISRRFLGETKRSGISYGALMRDKPFAEGKGRPYTEANKNNKRSCSPIFRCRS